MKVKVATLQYEVPEQNVENSFRKLDEMVMQASWAGAKLVVAPETATGDFGEVKKVSPDYLSKLSEIAHKNKVFLATSYYKSENEKYFNQGVVVASDGEVVVRHKKIYLAKPEIDDGVSIGTGLEVVETEIGKIGMLICKDGFNKFSHDLYSKFGGLGIEIICIPTWSIGWKEMDTQEYIKTLYTYGAFLSRSFVIVSGNLNVSTNSFGRSLIVDPIRGVLREGSANRKEILYEELDLDEVRKAREFDSWWQPKEKINI